jgi:dihydrofolate reductase
MGRRTWDERGQPLDGRRNIVISRAGQVSGAGREVVGSLEEALALARTSDPHPMIIGGEQIFRLALPLATRMLLTEVDFEVEGDTFFPPFDPLQWTVREQRPGDRASYLTYVRTLAPEIGRG